MPLDIRQLDEYAGRFFGYGSYCAPLWLLGIEEGGADTEPRVQERLDLWRQRRQGHLREDDELEDLRSFTTELGRPEYFRDPPTIQPTWGCLCRIALGAKGKQSDREHVGHYQRELLGQRGGETCLLELLPFPVSSTRRSRWPACYKSTPHLEDRASYQRRYKDERSAHFRRRLADFEPKAVVFYAMSWRREWSIIAGVSFTETKIGALRAFVGSDSKTLFVTVYHPASRQVSNQVHGPGYFDAVGEFVGRNLGRS